MIMVINEHFDLFIVKASWLETQQLYRSQNQGSFINKKNLNTPIWYYSVQLQSFRINITVHLVETLHCGNLTSIESRIGQLFDCEQSTYSYACASGLKKTHALVEVLASVPTLCSPSLIHANLVKQNWQLFCWNCLSNYLSVCRCNLLHFLDWRLSGRVFYQWLKFVASNLPLCIQTLWDVSSQVAKLHQQLCPHHLIQKS